MDDNEVTYIAKLVVCYHPTDRDKRGYDGVYVKESIMLPEDTIDILQRELESANKERAYLQQQLEIAVEALKYYDKTAEEEPILFMYSDIAHVALSEIEALNQLEQE